MPCIEALIDFTKGYWQIPLDQASKENTAFATPSSLYQFTKMPFGRHGAATSFQHLMVQALKEVHDCAVVYIENILVFSQTWEEHLVHLRRVLTALRPAGLVAN